MTVEQWLGESNKLGIDIWHNKYQHNNETFDEWLNRVSGGNKQVKQLIIEKKFLPGGRILSNRGVTDSKVTYSNCYVISPPEDNIESIYDCCKNLARTFSYGGGCGIDISKLAPAGAKVHNQARSTSGAVSFMETFSQVTAQIGQNGRRGALMISIDCHHPDLLEFIDIKAKPDSVTKANISVKVTDDFMQAVKDDKEWVMSFTRPETGETITKTARAVDIFNKLCQNNWDWAEPGILFWDRIENWNLLSNNGEFHYAGTNPCAEEPLPAGGSCLLGSMNLAAFVKDGMFDFEDFCESVKIAVQALNDILEEGLSLHPLEEQRKSVSEWRQIGLGIMGLADMLVKLQIPYDSDIARDLCGNIVHAMANQALFMSSKIAEEKGSYTKYDNRVMETTYFRAHADTLTYDTVLRYGLRNSQLLTIAPTGTLSTMLGISGGIEPIFANSYTRKTESLHGHDEFYKVYTPIVQEYMDTHGLKDESELPKWFVTSSDISPRDRIAMQAVWQHSIDASISSTINLPETATVEDIKDIYMTAWEMGLKGVTVFRNGCKRTGILTTDSKEDSTSTDESKPPKYNYITPVSRKTIGTTHGDTYCKKCACGTLYITLNRDDDGNVVESFIHTSKGGICQANTSAVNRLVSLCMRSGVKTDEIIDQLKGITCGACTKAMSNGIKLDGISCPDILARTLTEFCKPTDEKKPIEKPTNQEYCPECGEPIIHDGGCVQCMNCGWSKCS